MHTDQWSSAHFTGTKVSKVRWLPHYDQIGRATFFASGTAEEQVNKVTVWQLNLPQGDDKGPEPPFECFEGTHHGGVADLKAVEANNDVLVLTASTKGSHALYKVPGDLFSGDIEEGQVQALPRAVLIEGMHTSAATALDYSSDMRQVVTVGEDGTINALKLEATQPDLRLERAESCSITSVLFLGTSSILTASTNNTIKKWDLRSGGLVHSLREEGIITAITKHPFQLHRLTTAYSDGTVALWDLRQNAVFMTLKKHTSHVWEVQHHATAPDNLFTCSEDGFLYHWDIKAAQQGVTDWLGLNSFEVNPETNVLVCAGDTHSLQFRSSSDLLA